jgi:PKD repeat protein
VDRGGIRVKRSVPVKVGVGIGSSRRTRVLAVVAGSLLAFVSIAFPVGGPGGAGATGALAAVSPRGGGGLVEVAGAYAPSAGATWLGTLPAPTPLTLLVGLSSRDPGGLSAYEAASETPGTGVYRHFLTPAEIAARYGPTPSSLHATEQYFAEFGLRSQLSPDGLLLTVTGASGAVAGAFGTTFDRYTSADGRTFFSHPTPAHLPGSLEVAGVYGLGNVTPFTPLVSGPALPSDVASPAAGCSAGPPGLAPCQVSTAYDAAGLIASGTDGSGERIGIVDTYDGGQSQSALESDLASFDSEFSLPTPSVSYNYPVPTGTNLNATSDDWGVEEALDLEWAHASAPGASIAMTFAPNSGVGLYEAVDWLVAHQLVDVLSLSWGEPDVGVYNAYAGPCTTECNATSDGSYEVLGPVLAAAAAEGISVFVATGDCGAADGTSGVSTDYPASDPSVTAVGGTDLLVNASGVYQSESGWSGNSSGAASPGCQNQGGSGGGFSPFPRPYWQSGSGVPSSPYVRAVPDVSADAGNPVAIVYASSSDEVGGTSVATPIWAGFGAILDQSAGTRLGLLDPGLYAILRGSEYASDFHDITTGNNGYSAGPGWDPVTGIGSPIVAALAHNLAAPGPSGSNLLATLYANVTSGPAPLSVRFGVAASNGTAPYPLEGVYFGDGNSLLATRGSVVHTYDAPGVYAAVAFVADATGNLTASEPVAIVVGGGPGLTVTLSPSTSAPTVGSSVTFTASVVGGISPYSYLFAFGDGTFLNWSASARTSHVYGAPGGFCAEVLVQDSAVPVDGGESAPVAIGVGGTLAPDCTPSLGPLNVTALPSPAVRDAPADFPALFQVSGGASGAGGEGLTYAYTSSDPYVGACDCTILRTPGTYPVSLTVTDLLGHQASNTTTVTVAPALTATFSTSTLYGLAPLTVRFTVAVSGGYEANASRTAWVFGDGASTAGATVSHTYLAPGFYSATGDVSDAGFGNSSEGFLVEVLPANATEALTATFAPAVNLASGTTVRFAGATHFVNGSLAPSVLEWDLGENGTAWGPAPAQTYYAGVPGSDAALGATVTAVWGGSLPNTTATLTSPALFASEAGGFVPWADALHLSASGAPANGSTGLEWSGGATVVGPGPGPVGWSFGDGTVLSGSAVHHTYSAAGTYTVNVTETDLWSDAAVVPLGVRVGSGPAVPLLVQGGPSVEKGTAPLTVDFSASATGGTGPYSFAWATGDGTSGTNATFAHTYTTAGRYTASLLVHDSHGSEVQQNWTIVVVAASHPALLAGLELYLVIGAVVAAVAAGSALLWRRRERPPPPTP